MRRIAAVAALFLAMPLFAQTVGPHLEIRTASAQTTFHIGERIPLVLSFTGPETYGILLYNFGRFDTFPLDSYSISPSTGWKDSLAASVAFTPMGCCGARQAGKLSAKPTTLEVNLNEWARFDEPGTYTVQVTSHRVSSDPRLLLLDPSRPNLPSNTLQLQIVQATPAWQEETLERVRRELEKPHPQYGESWRERDAAMADLRYLDSPASIAMLAASVRDDHYDLSQEALLGLAGLRRADRETALAAMNRLIDDPAFPVSTQFVEAMTWVELGDEKVPELTERASWEAAYNKHLAAQHKLRDAAWVTIVGQLGRKEGDARSVTAKTLAELAPEGASEGDAKEIGASLRAAFTKLPPETQNDLLANQWELMRSRTLLPELRALAQSSKDANGLPWKKSLQANALARWYELEPDAALAEVRRRIGRVTPQFSADDLWFLPQGTTFPQFEALWAQGVLKAKGFSDYQPLLSLLLHFGTGGAAAQLAPVVEQPNPDYVCNRTTEVLAYLVKFSPETARRFLVHPVAEAPRTGEYNCVTGQLDSLGEYVQSPLLTEAAVSVLGDRDPRVVKSALVYLERFGDASVRKPILERYLAWQEEHAGSAPEAGADVAEDSESKRERESAEDVSEQFVSALLSNQGWLPDAALVATVKAHCTTKPACDAVERLMQPDLEVAATPPSDQFSLHIGNFHPATMELFEAKIEQFPKGTVFTQEHMTTGDASGQERFEASLPALFEKHGMKLVRPGAEP